MSHLTNFVFLVFSFIVLFYLNKIKLTMALHCKCKISLKALVVSKIGFCNHVYVFGDIHK